MGVHRGITIENDPSIVVKFGCRKYGRIENVDASVASLFKNSLRAITAPGHFSSRTFSILHSLGSTFYSDVDLRVDLVSRHMPVTRLLLLQYGQGTEAHLHKVRVPSNADC